jgi:Protein of unknown function (DUF1236)
MKEHLLITTAIGLMLGTAAFAQSPSEQPKTNSPPAAQNQTNSNSSAPAAASSSTTSSPSSTPSAQNTQSTPSGAPKSPTTTSQSAPNTTGNNDSSRSQAQSNQASPPSQGRTDNNAGTSPSQAQSAQPSNSPPQAQTSTAPPVNSNQTQSSPTGTNANTNSGAQPSTNTAAQPSNNQTNTAQSSSSNVRLSANLNENQRTRVSESIARLNVAPLNNVNFSLSVGTVVPRDARFHPLPADIVEVMPQYRGYNFFVVRDDIVIVDPASYKIVDVLPRTGRSTAAAPAPHRTTFSDRDREVIRKHARSPRIEQRTTGSAASTRVRVGERLPDSVEIRSFPDEVYRESPSLREYRYIERDDRTYVIEPRERTIIEEID